MEPTAKFDLNQLVQEFNDFDKTVDMSWEIFVNVINSDITAKIWRRPEVDGTNWQSWALLSGVAASELLEIYGDYDFRRKYMELTTSYFPIEREDKENGDYSHVVYWRVKLPLVGYFTAEREYLFRRTQKKIGDVTILLDESMPEHDQAPKNSKYVRVANYNSAMIFKEKEDHKAEVFVKYLTPLNIQMPIPQALLNWGATVGLNRYLTILKKAITEHQQLK